MPVNIQLSKISIASAIGPLTDELLSFAGTNPIPVLQEQTQFPCKLLILLVGPGGIEPPTSPLSGVRSSQLSYRPEAGAPLDDAAAPRLFSKLVELVGIEPATS